MDNSAKFEKRDFVSGLFLSKVLAKPKDLVPYVERHTQFAARIIAWSEKARADELIEVPAEILREYFTETQYIELLHEWLMGAGVTDAGSEHASFAIVRLRQQDPVRFQDKWGSSVAFSISRVAARRGSFEPMEIRYLYEVGHYARPAIDRLAKFVLTQLESPGELLNSVTFTYKRNQQSFRPLPQALEVLGRFPAEVRFMKPAVEAAKARVARDNPQNDLYAEALARFLKAIE